MPSERLARLTEGINLSHWWAQSFTGDYPLDHLDTYMQESDFDLIREIGFRHVRLTLNPRAIWNEEDPAALPGDRLTRLQSDVKALVEREVAVILDCHPEDELKELLKTDPEFVEEWLNWWRGLAASFARTDPSMVFFEVLNEPTFEDAEAWRDLQGRALRVIREQAPEHTIVVSGARWSGWGDLLQLEPYAEDNLIYNFHYYEPFVFTHQGATWGGDAVRFIQRLPYPSSTELVKPVLESIDDEEARGAVRQYGEERWNRQRMLDDLANVADWASEHGVPVTVNEFGTYTAVTLADDRERWLADAVSVFGEYGFGWTMWDYAEGFRAALGEPGERRADPNTVRALGLNQGG